MSGMMGPSWIPGTFAGIMLVVALLSAARLAAAVASHRWLAVDADADAAHLLMGISMAGMLASGLRALPAGVWEPVFGVLTAWFAVRVALESRGGRLRGWALNCHMPHLVHSVAMLYMFLAIRTATSGGAGMGSMTPGVSGGQVLALPTLGLVLALLLAGYTVRDLDRLTAPAAGWLAQPARAGAGAALVSGPVPVAAGGAGIGAALWVPASCRIAMGVTMAYMLIVMI
jgi:uncharacterized protein DUF5134